MAQTSFPITGHNFTEADWIALGTDLPGIVGDTTGNSFAWNTPNGDNAVIGAGQAKVNSYGFRISGTESVPVPTAAGTYLIVARYSSSNTGVPGPVRLACLSGTSYNILTDLPLWQVVRTANQALSAATVTDRRHWIGPSVWIAPGAPVPTNLPKGAQVAAAVPGDVSNAQLTNELNVIDWRLDRLTFAIGGVWGEAGQATVTNTLEWPFNNSGVTIPVQKSNDTYWVLTEVVSANGEVGEIVISNKTATNFKLSFTGSATSVVIRYRVLGGV